VELTLIAGKKRTRSSRAGPQSHRDAIRRLRTLPTAASAGTSRRIQSAAGPRQDESSPSVRVKQEYEGGGIHGYAAREGWRQGYGEKTSRIPRTPRKEERKRTSHQLPARAHRLRQRALPRRDGIDGSGHHFFLLIVLVLLECVPCKCIDPDEGDAGRGYNAGGRRAQMG
jgi:hypothetical protein